MSVDGTGTSLAHDGKAINRVCQHCDIVPTRWLATPSGLDACGACGRLAAEGDCEYCGADEDGCYCAEDSQ